MLLEDLITEWRMQNFAILMALMPPDGTSLL